MKYIVINTSEARKNLPSIMEQVDQTGNIVILTVHGKPKVAMVDVDLMEQFVENTEFGVTEGELLRRSKEKRIPLEEFKREFNV